MNTIREILKSKSTYKCNRCKNEKKCFVTAKQNKPIMKGLV